MTIRGFAGGSGYLSGVRGHVRSKNGTTIEVPGNNEFSKLYNAETQLLKKETGFGFIKLEYSETDYDEVSVTTSNSTKVSADIDTEVLALSVAKSF